MNAKTFLMKHWLLERDIACLKQEINDLQLKAESIGSFDYSGDKVQVSKDLHADFETLIERKVMKLEMLHELNQEWMRQLKEVERIISLVPNDWQREVLHCRYLSHMKFKDIAEEFCYSEQNVYVLHRKGIKWLRDHVEVEETNGTV